jgi:hypothetical protein
MTTRFPEFANIDPTLIQLALDEALLFMGDWQQPGLVPAQLYLAAHILALNSYAAIFVLGVDAGGTIGFVILVIFVVLADFIADKLLSL